MIALAAIGALGGIYAKGYYSGKETVQLEWAQANEEARQREAEASAKAAADLAEERKKRKVVVRERTVFVDREIEKLVQSGVCFSAPGVSCINAAIDGKSQAGCSPDRTVPAASPAR